MQKLVLALAAGPFAMSAAVAAEPVVEAERAFAARVEEEGFKRGFLAFSAPDAIMFAPAPTAAKAHLQRAPDADPPGPPLQWWPQWAGLSISGDFGFTTGAASIPVRYFTVWRKQSDGSWKWIYDGGPSLGEKMKGGPGDRPTYLRPATASAGSAEAALAEISPLEEELAKQAASDARAAHLGFLAEDGLVAGSPVPAYPGRAEQIAELARRPAVMQLKRLGGEASAAGDMAFTYGESRWEKNGKSRWGHYARIWQKRTNDGWKLVVDLLVAAPGEPLREPENRIVAAR